MKQQAVIHKKNAIKIKHSKKWIAYEYDHHDKDINIACIEIKGRHPDSGFVMNEKVKEIIFVTKGTGKIVIEKTAHPLTEGSAVLVLPKQKYYVEGNLTLVIPCTPAWTMQQHKQMNS